MKLVVYSALGTRNSVLFSVSQSDHTGKYRVKTHFDPLEYGNRFEFIGGSLCLDFANTINYAGASVNERLKSFADLVGWGCISGLTSLGRAEQLIAEARRRPADAAAALEYARTLRLAVHHVFSATAYGRPPDRLQVAALNAAMRQAAPYLQIKHTPKHFDFDWTTDAYDLNQIVWPVTWSAVALLTSPQAALVKRCQGESCSWLFLDETKNHSRRWCNMAHCGNRAKASRYYARSKGLSL